MLENLKSFVALKTHCDAVKDIQMRDMFNQNPQRAEQMTLRLKDFVLDFSKNRITNETLPLLFDLAHECNVAEMRDKMFAFSTNEVNHENHKKDRRANQV